MKTMIKTAACLAVLLLACACSLTSIDTQMTDEEAIAAIRLECSADESYTIPAERTQRITFHVSSTTPWTITGHEEHASWLSVSPTSSDESRLSADITVSVTSTNDKEQDRTATLTLSGKNTTITRKVIVKQLKNSGLKVEFASEGDAELAAAGGEVILAVNANTDWKFESSNPAFTVQKLSATQVKVSAPFNNKFAARKTTLSIRAADDAHAGVMDTKDITQGSNFKLSEGCELLGDGSVKLHGSSKDQIYTVDKYRYANLVFQIGDKNIGPKAQMWCAVNVGTNIYTQISLGGNLRVRQDGTIPGTYDLNPNPDPDKAGVSTYKNANLSGMDQAALAAITEYRFEVLPLNKMDDEYPTVPWQKVNFWYNGTLNTTLEYRSTLGYDHEACGSYWFGFNDKTEDGSWYVVKSCDISRVAED